LNVGPRLVADTRVHHAVFGGGASQDAIAVTQRLGEGATLTTVLAGDAASAIRLAETARVELDSDNAAPGTGTDRADCPAGTLLPSRR
jgi:hypothetical protein